MLPWINRAAQAPKHLSGFLYPTPVSTHGCCRAPKGPQLPPRDPTGCTLSTPGCSPRSIGHPRHPNTLEGSYIRPQSAPMGAAEHPKDPQLPPSDPTGRTLSTHGCSHAPIGHPRHPNTLQGSYIRPQSAPMGAAEHPKDPHYLLEIPQDAL